MSTNPHTCCVIGKVLLWKFTFKATFLPLCANYFLKSQHHFSSWFFPCHWLLHAWVASLIGQAVLSGITNSTTMIRNYCGRFVVADPMGLSRHFSTNPQCSFDYAKQLKPACQQALFPSVQSASDCLGFSGISTICGGWLQTEWQPELHMRVWAFSLQKMKWCNVFVTSSQVWSVCQCHAWNPTSLPVQPSQVCASGRNVYWSHDHEWNQANICYHSQGWVGNISEAENPSHGRPCHHH